MDFHKSFTGRGCAPALQEPVVRLTDRQWRLHGGCTHLARATVVAQPAEPGRQIRPKADPASSSQVSRGVPTLEPQIPGHQSYSTQACAHSGFLSQGRPRCSELCRPRDPDLNTRRGRGRRHQKFRLDSVNHSPARAKATRIFTPTRFTSAGQHPVSYIVCQRVGPPATVCAGKQKFIL